MAGALEADEVVYITDSPLGADKRVYVTDSPLRADKRVYVTDSPLRADKRVYVTDWPLGADEVVYITNPPLQADEGGYVPLGAGSDADLDHSYESTGGTSPRLERTIAINKIAGGVLFLVVGLIISIKVKWLCFLSYPLIFISVGMIISGIVEYFD
jgi:hypothetical protein